MQSTKLQLIYKNNNTVFISINNKLIYNAFQVVKMQWLQKLNKTSEPKASSPKGTGLTDKKTHTLSFQRFSFERNYVLHQWESDTVK